MTIRFTVKGLPQAKGSTRAFIPKGWDRPIVTSTNRNLKDWEARVRDQASFELSRLMVGPIGVRMMFFLPMPKSVKAPRPHQTKPDLDKLVRAVNDALIGVAFRDDSEITLIQATKLYAFESQPRVDITIEGFHESGETATEPDQARGSSPLPLH